MIQAKVARILSPTCVILSAGLQEGVREGMVFVIYQLGDPIIDPETHESLGQLEHIKGRVKVYHVQEKLCHASTFSRTETRVINPFEFAGLEALRPRKIEETVFEQLKVDSAVAVQTDLTVRVGDLVRSIE
jgi:hypothetical protein